MPHSRHPYAIACSNGPRWTLRYALAATVGIAASVLTACTSVAEPAPAKPAAALDVGARFERQPCTDGTPVADDVRKANLDLVGAFVREGLGMGDMSAFDRYIADDVWVSTGLKPGAPIVGRAEYKHVVARTLGTALSPTNAVLDIEEALVTVDGRVIIRFIAKADHTGTILGVEPTNLRLTLAETHLFCVRDGKIVENYVGGLNPLQWEMIYAASITEDVLP